MSCHNYLKNKEPYLLPDTPGIKLDIVENLFVPGSHKYPTRNDELINMLKQRFNSEIILTAGSDNALKLIIDTYFTPNAHIIIPVPTYPHFVNMANCTYSNIEYVECENEDEYSRLSGDILYVCSPNLPLGYEVDVEKLKSNFKLIILDQAYFEYGNRKMPVIDDKIIIVRTFSKYYALASHRIGYLACTNKRYRELHVQVNEKSITDLAQARALEALHNVEKYEKSFVEFCEARDYLQSELPKVLGPVVHNYNLRAGNFFLIYCNNPQAVCDAFAMGGLAIRNKHNEIPGAVRISIAPLAIMRNVVDFIAILNQTDQTIASDLDGTIRPNAKLTLCDPKIKEWIVKHKVDIITNNLVHTREQIIDTTSCNDVYQPTIPEGGWILGKERPDNPTCIVYTGHMYDIGTDAWAQAFIDNQYLSFYIIENSSQISISNMSETEKISDVKMPDIDNMLCSLKNIKKIGKPFPVKKYDLYFGDSDVDEIQAQVLGARFVRINKNLQKEYDLQSGITFRSMLDYVEFVSKFC